MSGWVIRPALLRTLRGHPAPPERPPEGIVPSRLVLAPFLNLSGLCEAHALVKGASAGARKLDSRAVPHKCQIFAPPEMVHPAMSYEDVPHHACAAAPHLGLTRSP